VKLIKDDSEDFFRHLPASIERMIPIHQHFRFDDGDQSRFLAQRGIAGQGLRVGLDAASGGKSVTQGNHGSPLGKASTHLEIASQSAMQPVQPFGDLLSRMAGQRLRADVHLDAGDDPRVSDHLEERGAVVLPLTDRLIEEDHPADGFAETGGRHEQFPIGAPGLFGLEDSQLGEPLVAGRDALVHRQQALVVRDERLRRLDQ
jgi:hypothetical protein